VEKREKTESQAVNFMVEEVGVRYLELYDYSEGIEAKLDQSHEVSYRVGIIYASLCICGCFIMLPLYKMLSGIQVQV